MSASPLWVAQRAAADQLGVSERTLSRWRASGLLEAGKHWRRKFPGSPNSPVLYRLEVCDQTMSESFARDHQLMEVA